MLRLGTQRGKRRTILPHAIDDPMRFRIDNWRVHAADGAFCRCVAGLAALVSSAAAQGVAVEAGTGFGTDAGGGFGGELAAIALSPADARAFFFLDARAFFLLDGMALRVAVRN